MKLLLDTHSMLWFIGGDSKLSAAAKAAILDPANVSFVSVATPWELAIKTSLGRFTPSVPLELMFSQQMQQNGFRLLPIELAHCGLIAALPFHHRDPFDRMMIAQATIEQMPIVSADAAFDAYGMQRIW